MHIDNRDPTVKEKSGENLKKIKVRKCWIKSRKLKFWKSQEILGSDVVTHLELWYIHFLNRSMYDNLYEYFYNFLMLDI